MGNSRCKEALTEKGLKVTKQRELVFDILMESEVPLTAEAIFIQVSKAEKNMSLSTVYRILNALIKKELVDKTDINEKKAVYELKGDGHKHHLICVNCGKIIALDQCPLIEYEKALGEKTGFDISGHKLKFYGCCPECKKSGKY